MTEFEAEQDAPATAERTRERILASAATLFDRRGYSGTSTRAIAEAVGIRQPSMFHHFASKGELMRALLAISLSPLHDLSTGLVGSSGPAGPRLARFGLAAVQTILGSPFRLGSILDDEVLTDPEFDGQRVQAERLRANVRALVEEGIAAGEFVPVDPRTAALAVEAVLLAGARQHPGGTDIPRYAADVVRLTLRMLLVDCDRVDDVVVEAGRAD